MAGFLIKVERPSAQGGAPIVNIYTVPGETVSDAVARIRQVHSIPTEQVVGSLAVTSDVLKFLGIEDDQIGQWAPL